MKFSLRRLMVFVSLICYSLACFKGVDCLLPNSAPTLGDRWMGVLVLGGMLQVLLAYCVWWIWEISGVIEREIKEKMP